MYPTSHVLHMLSTCWVSVPVWLYHPILTCTHAHIHTHTFKMCILIHIYTHSTTVAGCCGNQNCWGTSHHRVAKSAHLTQHHNIVTLCSHLVSLGAVSVLEESNQSLEGELVNSQQCLEVSCLTNKHIHSQCLCLYCCPQFKLIQMNKLSA